MTLSELFHKLINHSDMLEPEKRDGHALIDKLERMNAFGTLTAVTSAKHAFDPIITRSTDAKGLPFGPGYMICKQCGRSHH